MARARAEFAEMQSVIRLDAARAPTVEARDAQQFARAVWGVRDLIYTSSRNQLHHFRIPFKPR